MVTCEISHVNAIFLWIEIRVSNGKREKSSLNTPHHLFAKQIHICFPSKKKQIYLLEVPLAQQVK